VFIVGSKGIPGSYGGYETFVDKLTEYHQHLSRIKYHVACKANGRGVSKKIAVMPEQFVYHDAECFKVKVPEVGPGQAVLYDCYAIRNCLDYIRKNKIVHPIIYVLACRIGPFIGKYARELHSLGGRLFVNPDGHEWMRDKWSKPVRWYWKKSEQLMVKYADLLICDSKNIEKYIQKTYAAYRPITTYIAYGAETRKSSLEDNDINLSTWYQQWGLQPRQYYLVVGRFVPENNFETMIREFMLSNSKRNFAIITTKDDKFLQKLDSKLGFSLDSRIKFVGTVYDPDLLKKIREQAYGYIHGHEVGGTNPSLLEALGSTELNLLLDVGFNREVAENGGMYWSKAVGSLKSLLEQADMMDEEERRHYGELAKKRVREAYSWSFIANCYENQFITEKDGFNN
jgi:rhamnosyltransferase